MEREEILAQYDALRASIDRLTEMSDNAFSQAEEKKAAKKIAMSHWRQALLNPYVAMLIGDFAIHESDEKGRTVFERFVRGTSHRLSREDIATSELMLDSRFSVFRATGPHEVAGVWIEDLLEDGPPLWLMDRGRDKAIRADPGKKGDPFAMRHLFNGVFCANMFSVRDFGDFAPILRKSIKNLERPPTRSEKTEVCYQMKAACLVPGFQEEILDIVRRAQAPKAL